MTEEQKELHKKWKKLVNMTAKEIESFLDSDEGKEAGLSRKEASEQKIRMGRDSARAIIRMKEKNVDDWSSNDWEWCKAQVNFITRMSGVDGPLRKNDKPTRKLLALKVWGNDPEKLNEGFVAYWNDLKK